MNRFTLVVLAFLLSTIAPIGCSISLIIFWLLLLLILAIYRGVSVPIIVIAWLGTSVQVLTSHVILEPYFIGSDFFALSDLKVGFYSALCLNSWIISSLILFKTLNQATVNIFLQKFQKGAVIFNLYVVVINSFEATKKRWQILREVSSIHMGGQQFIRKLPNPIKLPEKILIICISLLYETRNVWMTTKGRGFYRKISSVRGAGSARVQYFDCVWLTFSVGFVFIRIFLSYNNI